MKDIDPKIYAGYYDAYTRIGVLDIMKFWVKMAATFCCSTGLVKVKPEE